MVHQAEREDQRQGRRWLASVWPRSAIILTVTVAEWIKEQGITTFQAAKILKVQERQMYRFAQEDYLIDVGEPIGRMQSFAIYKRMKTGFFDNESIWNLKL